MLNNFLTDILNRMLDKSDQEMVSGYDSSKTISWKALREAETLTDTDFIDNIIENVIIEKNKKRRNYMYFIVGRICENKSYQKGLEFLIDQIDKETDKYIISGILDRISDLEKPAKTNLSKIFEAINHKTWQVKYSAINALKNTNNPEVEKRMIELIESQPLEKSYVTSYAINVLYNCGSVKCISTLEKQLTNKSRNIKDQAKNTLQLLKQKSKN
jgi:soluble cytochrome b562